jgi:hypothetical protein
MAILKTVHRMAACTGSALMKDLRSQSATGDASWQTLNQTLSRQSSCSLHDMQAVVLLLNSDCPARFGLFMQG